MVAFPDIGGRHFEARPAHGVLETGAAMCAGREAKGVVAEVADERDAPVAQLEKMPRRQPAALDVIRVHLGQAGIAKVHQHHWGPAADQPVHLAEWRRH